MDCGGGLLFAWYFGRPIVGVEMVGAEVHAYVLRGGVVAQASPPLVMVKLGKHPAEGPEVCVGIGPRNRPVSIQADRWITTGNEVADLVQQRPSERDVITNSFAQLARGDAMMGPAGGRPP